MTTIRVHVVVHGRVQGVWFRDSCRREALERDVAGWVANRFDGSVEAVFEGRGGRRRRGGGLVPDRDRRAPR